MEEQLTNTPKALVGREFVTPMDQFRAASNASATILSGNTNLTSATVDIIAVTLSNVTRINPISLHLVNQEKAGFVTIEFRDGSFAGRRLLGPLTLNPASERFVDAQHLVGKNAYSSWAGVVLSAGGTASGILVSNGILVNLSFVTEPLDLLE